MIATSLKRDVPLLRMFANLNDREDLGLSTTSVQTQAHQNNALLGGGHASNQQLVTPHQPTSVPHNARTGAPAAGSSPPGFGSVLASHLEPTLGPDGKPQEKQIHQQYLKDFRVNQCPQFLQHKCTQHKPFTCFNWHFMNQRRRRPVKKADGTFNYSPDVYCTKYDETTGLCPDGDECPYLHRTAGDTERRYHLRYYKTGMCVYDTDTRGHCVKNGGHCAFAHGPQDLRAPVLDIRETMETGDIIGPDGVVHHGMNALDKERNALNEDPRWNDTAYVLANYKTELCKRPPRLCRQGYACPQFHNGKDRRRTPKKYKYRSTPCPNVKQGDEWGDPSNCESGDGCGYCHTRTEQQFHPEIYKSTKCNDIMQTGYCPRGAFCAFAHVEQEDNRDLMDQNVDLSALLPSLAHNATSGSHNTPTPPVPITKQAINQAVAQGSYSNLNNILSAGSSGAGIDMSLGASANSLPANLINANLMESIHQHHQELLNQHFIERSGTISGGQAMRANMNMSLGPVSRPRSYSTSATNQATNRDHFNGNLASLTENLSLNSVHSRLLGRQNDSILGSSVGSTLPYYSASETVESVVGSALDIADPHNVHLEESLNHDASCGQLVDFEIHANGSSSNARPSAAAHPVNIPHSQQANPILCRQPTNQSLGSSHSPSSSIINNSTAPSMGNIHDLSDDGLAKAIIGQDGQQQEKPFHSQYLKDFRVNQCPQFLQHKCTQHKPFTCFNWHFMNQRRRRPVSKADKTFNYSPDVYCTKYDETTGICPEGDECPYLHRTAGDTERRYHLRYYKTGMCVYDTDNRGHCVKNGEHCAFAHEAHDVRAPVLDIRETMETGDIIGPDGVVHHGMNTLDKERNALNEDPRWNDTAYVLANYKTDLCKRPPRLCRQGYACPQFHNGKDRRRTPKKYKYRSTPCPNVKQGDEWGDPSNCESGDGCGYCHTRTEQQFHPEIYKSTKCNDIMQTGYCPRGAFCAFAHVEHEDNRDLNMDPNVDLSTLGPSLAHVGSHNTSTPPVPITKQTINQANVSQGSYSNLNNILSAGSSGAGIDMGLGASASSLPANMLNSSLLDSIHHHQQELMNQHFIERSGTISGGQAMRTNVNLPSLGPVSRPRSYSTSATNQPHRDHFNGNLASLAEHLSSNLGASYSRLMSSRQNDSVLGSSAGSTLPYYSPSETVESVVRSALDITDPSMNDIHLEESLNHDASKQYAAELEDLNNGSSARPSASSSNN